VVNVLTHCNAGWLATVDWGTAIAPIYKAHDKGIPVHVWVDETRPRNQGASLTAWELFNHGVPHTVIVDNAGGHLMQHGQVVLQQHDVRGLLGNVDGPVDADADVRAAKCRSVIDSVTQESDNMAVGAQARDDALLM
jgi:hypothetical protein